MDDQQRAQPDADEQVERTGRTEQVAAAGAAGSAPPRPGVDEDDAPPGGVDSADFPGVAAP